MKTNKMKKGIRVLHWTPRILCILAILFISLLAMDSFGSDLTFRQQLGEFLLHLVPSYILVILLIIAWKWELIGGIIFALTGLVFSPVIFQHNYKMNGSVWASLETVFFITIPFFIVGILFIVSHYRKKKQSYPPKGN